MYRTNKSIDESAGLLRDLVSSLESLITQSGTDNQFFLENTKCSIFQMNKIFQFHIIWIAVKPVKFCDFKVMNFPSEKKKPPGDLNSVEIKPDSKPSPERRTEKAKIETFSPLRESQVPSRNSVNSTEHRTKSTCPVCSVLIPTTNLSQHLKKRGFSERICVKTASLEYYW